MEKIVGIERYDASVRMNDMNAGTLDSSQAKTMAIEKFNDRDAKNVFVRQLLW